MTTKLALVVDDSRMARHMLSKMLKEQGIDVDTVESGEEALGYLCDKKPSMIFMDHTMPGMDGFQTLRAIKNDPHTSFIPIIMYTSKEGEVYESQARALGAVDVIPKTLKPLQLAKMLERQNLLPSQANLRAPSRPIVVSTTAANDVVIVESETAATPVFESTRELKPQPAASPAVASKATTKTSGRTSELHELEERLQALTVQLENIHSQPLERRAMNRGYRLQYLGLALCVALIGLLLLYNGQLNQKLGDARSENGTLKKALLEQSDAADTVKSKLETQLSSVADQSELANRRFYESIEWAMNQEGQFAFNEKPFNDKLAGTLSQLADNLQSVGFTGMVNVRSHLGRFCAITSDSGEQVLPEEGQTLNNCEVMQFDGSSAEATGNEQTSSFSGFLAAFEAEYGNTIRLEFSTAGDRRPLVRYPVADPDMEASAWNKIAARNQRVEISINPE